jgi:drug/metabolite transporter (DMT)-like permease
VTASALGLVLASAFLHAVWNLLLARGSDLQAAAAVSFAAAWVAGLPAAVVDWHVVAAVWPYALASSLLELVYIVLLAAAYTRAELSLVYPIARGLAPVLVLGIGVAFLGTGSSAGQAAGVCLVATGVVLVRRLQIRGEVVGLVLGLAIAAAIASYTLVARHGVRHASPLAYFELIMLLPGVGFLVILAAMGRGAAIRRELRMRNALVGILTWSAYVLVLEALRRAPAAPVAAVRETSVVFATALAAAVLGEHVGWTRFAGAAFVAGGIVLIGVS